MERKECDKLAKIITKAGEILIECGAETYRVEDTMFRLAKAYGASVVDAYATPSLLIISFSLKDEMSHNIKRIFLKDIDLRKVEAVNTISRQATEGLLSMEELDAALDEIRGYKPNTLSLNLLATAISCFGFGFFFNGGIKEVIWTIIIGMSARLINILFKKLTISEFINNMVVSTYITAFAILLNHFSLCDRHIVTIATLMLFVPGLAITNAIRDSINGDLMSGMARGLEALFIAIALAVGSGFAMTLLGGLYV